MAECHPVGFQWVMEAKERGATVIHVDPRFTRTSALADVHVPIRAGSDIAFLGGIVRHIIENRRYFHDYVVEYTNAATLINPDFRDTEDLDGLFSGFNAERRAYDISSWQYEGMTVASAAGEREQGPHASGEVTGGHGTALEHGEPPQDRSLEDPRCVFQLLRRHYARPSCGLPRRSAPTAGPTAPRRSSTRWDGPNTASASSTSAPRR